MSKNFEYIKHLLAYVAERIYRENSWNTTPYISKEKNTKLKQYETSTPFLFAYINNYNPFVWLLHSI